MRMFHRVLLICLAVLVSGNTVAQRLNALCQKMVSRIEIIHHNNDGYSDFQRQITVDFTYDDDCALIGLVLVSKPLNHNGETKRYEIRRNGGTLVRTDYIDGKVDKDFTYRYEMDGTRIAKIEEYNHATNGTNECMRYDFELEYNYPYNDVPNLKSITDTWYVRMAGTNTFVKGDGQFRGIGLYRLEDGNFNHTSSHVSPKGDVLENPFKEGVYLYDSVEDDTNINWNYLVMNYIRRFNLFGNPEFFTDWVGLHSFNHLIAVRDRSQHYDLAYFNDEKGNLSKINVYRYRNEMLYMEVSVSYVEDK